VCLDVLLANLDFCAGKLFLAALGEPNWLSWASKYPVACARQGESNLAQNQAHHK